MPSPQDVHDLIAGNMLPCTVKGNLQLWLIQGY